MPKIKYLNINLRKASLDTIDKANEIIAEYRRQGFDLTLRQLYYQFVARGLIPNKDTEYKKLGSTINDGRLAGLIDWNSIVDRTRNLRGLSHWESPSSIVEACAKQYHREKWETQPYYIEVWIEKDALVGVLEGICNELDLSYFSCRGYTSQSEMWVAAQRIRREMVPDHRTNALVIHLGDHDPSGIDMSRDIQDRLSLFEAEVEVRRIALTMDQVRQYNPPPNPAKLTDSRCEKYIQEYGDESWELDALEPSVIADLIRDEVYGHRDVDLWDEALVQERTEKDQLGQVSDQWETIIENLE